MYFFIRYVKAPIKIFMRIVLDFLFICVSSIVIIKVSFINFIDFKILKNSNKKINSSYLNIINVTSFQNLIFQLLQKSQINFYYLFYLKDMISF